MRILLLTFLSLTSCFTLNAAIWHVSPSGSGNGSSWANAAPGNDLQTIIDNAAINDQVWVMCGTYFTTNTSDRSIAFHMRTSVAIYGSFTGTETTLSQRALTCGPCSSLSGEIGSAGNTDNSYHVVSNPTGIDNSAILDGFIIENANDDRAPTITDGLGGGIYNNGGYGGNSSNPTIRNCLIRNNFAQFGAGIFNSGHSGGTASPVISNCIITGNTAYLGGGGIDNFGLAGNASPTLTNCLIVDNTALDRAGGMYCWGGNNGNANPTIVNCVFANNTAIDGGGLVSDRENSPPGSFSGNSNPTILNSVFWGNAASGTGDQFFLIGNATFNATYSDIDLIGQTNPHIVTGPATGNLNINPQFSSPLNAIGTDNCWLTSDDGFIPQSSSPLINAGTLSGAPASDIRDSLRTGNPDIGAYEYQAPSVADVHESEIVSFIHSPNPASELLTITFQDGELHVLELVDLTGKMLFSSEALQNQSVDIRSFNNGIYLVRIDGVSVKKWVKE
ncbi:MAG: T9SS type A sorting domain-containing protein [Fluviicola sp.]|nr:T9SS type A sorting domain-containing protein [Fluviicola sp.]